MLAILDMEVMFSYSSGDYFSMIMWKYDPVSFSLFCPHSFNHLLSVEY